MEKSAQTIEQEFRAAKVTLCIDCANAIPDPIFGFEDELGHRVKCRAYPKKEYINPVNGKVDESEPIDYDPCSSHNWNINYPCEKFIRDAQTPAPERPALIETLMDITDAVETDKDAPINVPKAANDDVPVMQTDDPTPSKPKASGISGIIRGLWPSLNK